MNRQKIEEAISTLLFEGLEVDPKDHNFTTTPQRVAKVFEEVFAPPETALPVFDEDYTDLVLMRNHVFWTFCPHHLLPVKLTASVAYLPEGKVIGASKLLRMLHDVNRQPMTQEKLTAQVICRIRQLTCHTSRGEAVYVRGEHGCFTIRGVRSHEASLITLKFGGEFQTDHQLQQRFLDLINH